MATSASSSSALRSGGSLFAPDLPSSFLSQTPSARATEVDIDQIDFAWLANLTSDPVDIMKLKKGIKLLEKEGGEVYYKELMAACRDTLRQIDPQEQAKFQGDKQAKSESKQAIDDLFSWTADQQKRERDRTIMDTNRALNHSNAPTIPIRGMSDSTATDTSQVVLQPETSHLSIEEKKSAANLERQKGNDSFKSKEYREAILFYSRGLKYDSQDYNILNNRALCFLKLEKPELDFALNDALLSIQANSSAANWKAYFRRGHIYQLKGNDYLPDAIKDLTEAILKNRKDQATNPSENTQIPNKSNQYPESLYSKLKLPSPSSGIIDNAELLRALEKALIDLKVSDPTHPLVAHFEVEPPKPTKPVAAPEPTPVAATSKNGYVPMPAAKRMVIEEIDTDDEDDESAPVKQTKSQPAGKKVQIVEVDDEEEETPKRVVTSKSGTKIEVLSDDEE